jgi:hypothetical protein
MMAKDRRSDDGHTPGLPCAADYAACKFFFPFGLGSSTCSNGKTRKNCLFEYKVTAIRLLITTCISAVEFANYVEYKLHFLALLISAVNLFLSTWLALFLRQKGRYWER